MIQGGRPQVEGKKAGDNELASWLEADVERGGTHGKKHVDDEKEGGGNHVDYEGRWVNDTRQQESGSYGG
jgi:hypothetical protein